MAPKKCIYIAKSPTDTQHVELEPMCTGSLCSEVPWPRWPIFGKQGLHSGGHISDVLLLLPLSFLQNLGNTDENILEDSYLLKMAS
jgi:hypothetical protein